MMTARWLRIACFLSTASALAACDGVGTDVGNPGAQDDVGFTEDTGGATDAGGGGGFDTGTDAGASEDTGPTPDTGGEDAGMDAGEPDVGEDAPDAFADTGVDVMDDTGDAGDVGDVIDMDALDAGDAADVIEIRSPWEPGETPADYPFGYDSIIDRLTLLEDAEGGRDLTGDGEPDNALGALVDTLGGVVEDLNVNGALATAIEAGELNIGFGWPSYDSDGDRLAGPAEANFFVLTDPDDDPFTRDAWTVPLSNFIDGTGEPRVRFVGEVDEADFASLRTDTFTLRLPFFGIDVNVELLDAGLDGEVVPSDDGVVMDGVITGAAPVDAMWDAFNGVIASCDCVTGGPLIVGTGPSATCGTLDTSACGGGDAETCTALPEFCTFARAVIVGALDVDTDGDDEPDAFSAALQFEANAAVFSIAE